MKVDDIYSELTLQPKGKMALVVLDGIGDIATPEQGYQTPLEAAKTPNLDALAKESALGRLYPTAPGITPGSGPGHLGLFGYDPLEFQVGRGVIESLGLGLDLIPGDVAARANFCTLDDQNIVTDRRAGRIETSICEELCALLAEKIQKIDDVEVIVKPGKSHRFVVIFRGPGMEGPLSDSDPHREGLPIPPAQAVDATNAKARKTAEIIGKFYQLALPVLRGRQPANGFLMRGIAHKPAIPTFDVRYKLKPACIAIYPMYKGLAQLVGMDKLEGSQNIAEEMRRYVKEYDNYDYFFIHFKNTDMYGEDGNFKAKTQAVEEFDAALPILLEKRPDVIAITGDHSTPCAVQGHSWHPQPVLLHSKYSGCDGLERFTEKAANCGSLGHFEAKYLIRHMQANLKMFDKFGA